MQLLFQICLYIIVAQSFAGPNVPAMLRVRALLTKSLPLVSHGTAFTKSQPAAFRGPQYASAAPCELTACAQLGRHGTMWGSGLFAGCALWGLQNKNSTPTACMTAGNTGDSTAAALPEPSLAEAFKVYGKIAEALVDGLGQDAVQASLVGAPKSFDSYFSGIHSAEMAMAILEQKFNGCNVSMPWHSVASCAAALVPKQRRVDRVVETNREKHNRGGSVYIVIILQYTCMSVCMHTYMYIYMYISEYYICMYVCMHA